MNHQIFRTNNREVKEVARRFKIFGKRERKPPWGGGRGGGVFYAPPRDPTPYPFVYHFDRKNILFTFLASPF